MDFAVKGYENKPSTGAFDPFFGIKIANPKVTLDVFNVYCGNLNKVPLKSLTANIEDPNFITMGVIVQTSGSMKSAKNSEYVIWTVEDLVNDKKIKLLLFGSAASAHWKLQTGFVVGLSHLQLAPNSDDKKSSVLTFKLIKDIQVVALGFCPDFGTCQGLKKDGQKCTNHVNLSVSPNCDYHLQQAANKFRSNRGAFSAVSNERPKCAIPREPRSIVVKQEDHGDVMMTKRDMAGTSKVAMKPGDRALIAARARLGQRVLTALADNQSSSKQEESKKVQPTSMKEFLAGKTKEERIRKAILKAGSPQLGKSTQRGVFADLTSPQKPTLTQRPLHFKDLAARAKAAEILKKSQKSTSKLGKRKASIESASPAAKRHFLAKFEDPILRPNDDFVAKMTGNFEKSTEIQGKIGGNDENKAKNGGNTDKKGGTENALDERIKKLLARKSTHQKEIDEDTKEREEKYFKQKEIQEKVESRMTNLMEMKDMNVVTCRVCDYTAPSPSDLCLQLCHDLVRHKATKRWYKCKDCNVKAAVYSKLPTSPCTNCGAKNFERVAMKDERRVELRPKLEVRGEERKFVNV
ncbi:unnamed protein product [Bursaphelenchus okinawaensis]|uniref:Protein MCM10 homolog n=1 Tax=Bursaphelenchus okinawaensis TaxID=465554 RepID=A0A811JWE8_9BILA|nr:unnamed protein product [Bursaphelenchus okinawaensis]CAG9085663.1 unnamed protein product [Bursaphelenchus okinawaensis]